MHKVLFILSFLLIAFFLPYHETLAKEVPLCTTESIDESKSAPISSLVRDGSAKVTGANCTNDSVCVKTSGAVAGNPIYKCYQSASGATTGTSTTATTPQCTSPTDPNCTGGRGQMCWIAPGSADNGKAVPAGTIPAAGTKTGILTAIGCIPTEPQALVEGLLKYGTFASAAIAFLLMILGALQMITAEGNPESVKHGQERFYSAIIGLLLIIFSVLLLQVIGVDVLGLKGFGA